MMRPRGVCHGAVVVCLACAPHERPQEPAAPCPTGMAEIGGDGDGALGVARVCMDLTEVTTAAYGACVQAGVCTPAIVGIGEECNLTRKDRGDHPINCATWEQAQTYCGWLGKRLPDDEEWIWAAQGGAAATPYPWGRTPPDAKTACWDRKAQGTCPVGGFAGGASPAGILDLIGNAAEWTRGHGARTASALEARGRLRGGSHADSSYKQPIDERWADSARDEPAEAATVTSGLRCVVAPDSPVQVVDESKWQPYAPTPGGLPPVLATTPAPTVPVRPLANLGVLDMRVEAADVWWALGDGVVELAPTVGAGLGLTEHVSLKQRPAALDHFRPQRWLGDVVLLSNFSSYDLKLAAVEPTTFKLRWQVALGATGRSYEQVVTPRTLVGLFATDTNSALIGYALDSGREVWRTRGEAAAGFTHLKQVWHDGERVFGLGDAGVVAFDANTGARLWSAAVGQNCGVAHAPGVLVIEDAAGYRRVDPADGSEVRRFGAPGACAWGLTRWDGGSPAGALAGDVLVTLDPAGALGAAAGPTTLRAFDMTSGAERWRRARLTPSVLVADQDAVLVVEGERLLALDVTNGVTRAEVSFGGPVARVTVQPGGGAAGPLVVVDASYTGQWVLGRRPEPTPPEAYVIRGRLVASEILARWQVGNVPVRVGDQVVRTGKDGRFEARGRTIGAVGISLGTDRGPDQRGGSRVTFEDTALVLDGSGKYALADIALTEWSLY